MYVCVCVCVKGKHNKITEENTTLKRYEAEKYIRVSGQAEESLKLLRPGRDGEVQKG